MSRVIRRKGGDTAGWMLRDAAWCGLSDDGRGLFLQAQRPYRKALQGC